MSIARIEFYSQAMGQNVTYSLILPDYGEGPFPVLFQLHGLTDSHGAWIEKSNLTRHASGYPLAIAMPDGGTACYLNWLGHDLIGKRLYEDVIVKDIADHLRRHFNVTDGPWAIGGLSMGGYGSLRIGLKHPELFASIWSHSAKIEFDELGRTGLFADPVDLDIRHYARKLVDATNRPVLTFDCGTEDELLEENRRLHAYLNEIGLEHAYSEHPGGHVWDYWDLHVQSALEQHARVLGIERVIPEY